VGVHPFCSGSHGIVEGAAEVTEVKHISKSKPPASPDFLDDDDDGPLWDDRHILNII